MQVLRPAGNGGAPVVIDDEAHGKARDRLHRLADEGGRLPLGEPFTRSWIVPTPVRARSTSSTRLSTTG